jgi:hypothetical protein
MYSVMDVIFYQNIDLSVQKTSVNSILLSIYFEKSTRV